MALLGLNEASGWLPASPVSNIYLNVLFVCVCVCVCVCVSRYLPLFAIFYSQPFHSVSLCAYLNWKY